MIMSKIILRSIFLLSIIVSASGCTRAHLIVTSQPEGAYITERGTGKSFGTTPVVLFYDAESLLKYKTANDCYIVKGFDARWVSGATASL